MTKITAIIPTLNEEIHIADAIESVSFADEIIVIDSHSTDKTVSIAEKYQVKIIKREFDDFSSQKNYAIDQAKYDWIYILDADERVTPEVKKEIFKSIKNPKDFVGFYVRRSFYFAGKHIKYGGCQRDKVVRLFLKDYCKYEGVVHETIKAKGKLGFFKNKIEHYSYKDYDHYISKMNHYGELRAKQYFEEKKKINFLFYIIIKPLARFFIHFVVRLGFLDLYQGYVFAKAQAYGVYVKYLKLWLLNRRIGIKEN
ncbi:glycosyltransferase family 2 protein [uncultured Polaribacter sp.]|uniref:glycosyltransferase family 2 protein n=1 Tax=uncultured Polaribacter sp. TaxID=174711 RepID=UPI00259BCA02|nr:glycosyltransferase family 2 protein [uncultured Polaribacter sp.]